MKNEKFCLVPSYLVLCVNYLILQILCWASTVPLFTEQVLVIILASLKTKQMTEHRIPSLLFLLKQHDTLFSVWLSYHTSFFNIYLFNNKTWLMFSSQLSFITISILQWKWSPPHSSRLHFLWKYLTHYAVLYSEYSDFV